jgi:hypothetical protein
VPLLQENEGSRVGLRRLGAFLFAVDSNSF